MVKRLLIIIPTLFLLSASPAFADGNIVAILVALRNEDICTDSCSIYEYNSNSLDRKLLGYYSILSSSIYEYDSNSLDRKLLRYYSIASTGIYEYDSNSLDRKLLRYYSY